MCWGLAGWVFVVCGLWLKVESPKSEVRSAKSKAGSCKIKKPIREFANQHVHRSFSTGGVTHSTYFQLYKSIAHKNNVSLIQRTRVKSPS
jgi:hypothetical protein